LSTDVQQKIGKYAAENKAENAVRKFRSTVDDLNVHTVRNWKVQHIQSINGITSNRTAGRSVALGYDIDEKVKQHIRQMRLTGGPISNRVVICIARAYLQQYDPVQYTLCGEQILTRGLSQSILQRMNFVKRKVTKAAKKLPSDFNQLRDNFHSKIQDVVKTHNVPNELIVNWDQTGVFLVRSSKYSIAEVCSKQVSVIASNDKRQITALLTINACSEMLSPQLIYQGKTDNCHAKYKFPFDYSIDHTPSHWSDSESMIRYLKAILLPYIIRKRFELSLFENQTAIAIFDVHTSHRYNAELHSILRENFVEFIYVPACCTSELQPLDADGGRNYQ
jgi:hypothetical protein